MALPIESFDEILNAIEVLEAKDAAKRREDREYARWQEIVKNQASREVQLAAGKKLAEQWAKCPTVRVPPTA